MCGPRDSSEHLAEQFVLWPSESLIALMMPPMTLIHYLILGPGGSGEESVTSVS